MDFNFKDFKRFEKQIILKNIGIRGQKRIFKSRVLIIGIGGLGCPLLTYLAASGVGTLGIVDYDRIELSISEGVKVKVIKNTIQGHLKKEIKK